tara:strand:- start:955 stop:2691 length:1737 start_codon:yes stop_codon:yes gene_type:complete
VHFSKLYNENGISMPTIEGLARHGLVFEHAFSNAPVCSVARTTLLVGSYAPRIGAQYHRRSKLVPMPDGSHIYPWYLQQAGYYTTNNRKTDYNVAETEGWNESSSDASWRNRKPGQPFFHVQNTALTHESSLHFSKEEMKRDATVTDPDLITLFPYFPDTAIFRYTHAQYLDNHVKVDNYFARYMEMLKKDGLLEDTFIFYFGDHGGVLPRGKGYVYENGLHVPLVVYVPENYKHLIDVELGSRVDGFVSFIDFAPTILNLAGIDVPAHMDGKPFLGQKVSMDEVNRRDEAFGYADRLDEKIDHVRALRKGNMKYIRNYQPFNVDALFNEYRYRMLAYSEWLDLYISGTLTDVQKQFFEPRTAEQLFDLSSDPFEINNLAQDPAHADTLKLMRKRLSDHVKSINDLSVFPESVLFSEAFDNPVSFGRRNTDRIARLFDIADLALGSFDEVDRALFVALESKDAWERYWALIVLSSFGYDAKSFVSLARKIAFEDEENLVRVRAAEFLGLVGAENPESYLVEALRNSRTEMEAVIILNSVVLLRDYAGYQIEITRQMIPKQWQEAAESNINLRLNYLVN